MAFGNTVTITGNVTRDPELRYTQNGSTVASFSVAWNRRYTVQGQQREETSFFDVTAWGTLADNISSSLQKGMRVIVTGELQQRSWERQDGSRQSKVEIKAEDVAPSLRFASASVEKNPRDDQFSNSNFNNQNNNFGNQNNNFGSQSNDFGNQNPQGNQNLQGDISPAPQQFSQSPSSNEDPF